MQKQNLVCYPAILDDSINSKGVYNVTFPDLPEIITFGDGLPKALYMASDALGTVINDVVDLPEPSDWEEIRSKNPGKIVTLVFADLTVAKQQTKDYKNTHLNE
ncbi:type II toxin-antitoxin system HicB family antitoxin [Companilactobacillus ginsenosidimutans]|uniref:HicB-like antitoxin of toxin-antitoxin system domain-containing protein n=1 Tax=Companilactobacillus ginsenosidimutans TaxID=1007676 RepID=A0A0H4R168_9LACO|nr:type II toxin-antitoxin system HicB family antitoxin [Companilactobacillus ginsenosidimutans]AKP67445.1 hypothetical protein ABM34_07805 [Companilactobacillus ginsenosidimutans]